MLSPLSNFEKRKFRVRNRVKDRNKSGKPRITVFRSNKNFYAQLINLEGKVLFSFSSLKINKKDLSDKSGVDIASFVGKHFADLCVKGKFQDVVFDKGAYLYNGRVKAFANSCRESGLKF